MSIIKHLGKNFCPYFIVVLLFTKVVMANDVNVSFRNDPLIDYVALGVLWLVLNEIRKNP